jgi:hypothetical protein
MSLASNVYASLHPDSPNPVQKLTTLRDDCDTFNEMSCATRHSSLGRYSSKDTLPTLIKFKALVENLLSTAK